MQATTRVIRIKKPYVTVFIAIAVFLWADIANAELSNENILNEVLDRYQKAASSWAGVIQGYAEYFFSGLAVMGFVWQLSQAYFHSSSFAEVFGEIIRYVTFCGFFLWLLRNGPKYAADIISSMVQIGREASNQGIMNPSDIVDLGFSIFDKACELLKSDISTDHILVFILALFVLVIITLIGVNMLLQLCSAWVLAYAGVIFLAFGGSYWTKDMAVNYFKTVLGVGASLMTMTLLIGIGASIINDCIAAMSTSGELVAGEMGVLLVTSITLFMLVDKLPSFVAGIINGASVGSAGIGSFGAGAAIGAAASGMSMAATSISKSASMIATAAKAGAGVAAGVAGMASAYKATKQSLTDGKGSGGSTGQDSGLAKPPSATAVLGQMGKIAGNMAMGKMGAAFNNAKENSMGGKIAANINGKNKNE